MASELNPVSQKRRVGVDEDLLYDFTEDELNFIRRSREEDDSQSTSHPNRNYVKAKSTFPQQMKSRVNGDNVDGQEDKYFSTLALDNLSYSSQSSDESFQTADSYPEIEGSRCGWADSDSGGGCSSMSRSGSPSLKRSRSNISNAIGDSECQPGVDNFSLGGKKIVVPEPELSDPNFPGFESSIEETSPIKPLNNSRHTLRQKFSTFGSFRKGSSGGYFGSYVIRKPSTEVESQSRETNQVQHNGYFRLWFTKFRNQHFL